MYATWPTAQGAGLPPEIGGTQTVLFILYVHSSTRHGWSKGEISDRPGGWGHGQGCVIRNTYKYKININTYNTKYGSSRIVLFVTRIAFGCGVRTYRLCVLHEQQWLILHHLLLRRGHEG